MKEDDLIRKLNSVGKRSFVENYDLFCRFAAEEISRENAINKLMSRGVSNEAGSAMRLGNAKLIFKGDKQVAALEIVASSLRVDEAIRKKAAKLMAS